MTQDLESILRELGLSQYLDKFLEQGFDSWETILDIQETDFDALRVKLGHRRKLQRRIANARGHASGDTLASPTRSLADDLRQDNTQIEAIFEQQQVDVPVATKRKYRRHARLDANAPRRPLSGYVLFSNQLRERLKDQNLTFAEIAKLVGEHWQSISSGEREMYEKQSKTLKADYKCRMQVYKETAEYQDHQKYLKEFEKKYGKDGLGRAQSQEAAKKFKPKRSSTSGNTVVVNGPVPLDDSPRYAFPGSGWRMGSGSSSERMRQSLSYEPSPSQRRDSFTSIASVTESRPPSTVPKATAFASSPGSAFADADASYGGQQRHERGRPSLCSTSPRDVAHPTLPPLSDVFGGSLTENGLTLLNGFTPVNERRPLPQCRPPLPVVSDPSPSLVPETSPSFGSTLAGTATCPSRRSNDGPLSIHDLLSHQSHPDRLSPPVSAMPSATEGKAMMGGPCLWFKQHGPISEFQRMQVDDMNHGSVLNMPVDRPSHATAGNIRNGLDGMNALLRAGELVGRNGCY